MDSVSISVSTGVFPWKISSFAPCVMPSRGYAVVKYLCTFCNLCKNGTDLSGRNVQPQDGGKCPADAVCGCVAVQEKAQYHVFYKTGIHNDGRGRLLIIVQGTDMVQHTVLLLVHPLTAYL